MARWAALLLAVAVGLCGCGDDPRGCTDVMLDSLDGPYPTIESSPDGEPRCFPGIGPHTPIGHRGEGHCDTGQPSIVYDTGRFFAACPGCTFGFEDCRPLVCETDEDCPWYIGDAIDPEREHVYECRNGLCQNTGRQYPPDTVQRSQAELLCFAYVPRGTESVPEFCPGAEADTDPCPLPLPWTCAQP